MLSAGPDPAGPAEERVERPSVDELLDRAAKRRICVVIGAAGWGKTTAVAAWSRNRPTAWLRYEPPGEGEDDEARLLAALVGVLRAHVSASAPMRDMPAADTDRVGSPVAAVCAWLRSVLTTELVLVLDDLHGLQPDSEAAGIVESLCQRAPERLHLVLISRSELPFSLQRLRGRGLVTEIHAPDLAFDVADVETLLRKTVGSDPPGLSRQVWEHTAGWPTAVHCAVEMLRAVGPAQR
ncbi:MAG: AAA family ATPase, partial [Pseudonocardiaceae bacterium]